MGGFPIHLGRDRELPMGAGQSLTQQKPMGLHELISKNSINLHPAV